MPRSREPSTASARPTPMRAWSSRLRLVAVPAAALLLLACQAGASLPPGTTPTASTASSSAVAATSTPAPTVTASLTATPTGLAHATGSHDLLLRSVTSGGLLAPGALLAEQPSFSLYGDGTVLYLSAPAGSGRPGPGLQQATVDEAELDRLLTFALEDGHLREARAKYDASGVADAPTTVFTIHAGGVDKVVSVYALGIASPEPADAADRGAFKALEDLLTDFGKEVEAGRATAQGAYEPSAYRAYLLPGEMRENLDWPWSDFGPEDFKVADETGQPSRVLTPTEASKLAARPANGLRVEVVGPDRAPYLIVLTAVLPDDAT